MKQRFPLVIAVLLLAMTACDFEPSPKLSVSPNPLEVSAEGGKVTLSVSAVGQWKTKSDYGQYYGIRYNVYPYCGKGDAEISVTIEPNPTIEPGRGNISFECVSGDKTCIVSLTVSQKGAEPVSEFADWNEVRVPAAGGSFSAVWVFNFRGWIEIDTEDVTYTTTGNENGWLYGSTEVTFSVPANTTGHDREIRVSTYLGNDLDKPLNVYKFTQAGS